VVSDVQVDIAEVGQAECGNHVPHSKEANAGTRLYDLIAAWPLDASLLNAVAEIQGRGGTAAEANHIDDGVSRRPGLAQVVVRIVDARQLAEAKYSAEDFAQDVPASADASEIEIICL
jgi:hypothetical protein